MLESSCVGSSAGLFFSIALSTALCVLRSVEGTVGIKCSLDMLHLSDSTARVLVGSSGMLTSFALFASLTHSGGGFL